MHLLPIFVSLHSLEQDLACFVSVDLSVFSMEEKGFFCFVLFFGLVHLPFMCIYLNSNGWTSLTKVYRPSSSSCHLEFYIIYVSSSQKLTCWLLFPFNKNHQFLDRSIDNEGLESTILFLSPTKYVCTDV